MTEQLTLARMLEEPRLHSKMQRSFEAFHRANPHVLESILQIARDLRRRGFQHTGMSLIFERLRWLHALQTQGEEPFKLNNNYRAFYARVAMTIEPRLDGFFRLREQEVEYEPDLDALGL